MNTIAKLDIYTVIGNGENGATILDLIVTIIGLVIISIVYFLPIKNKNLHNNINVCVLLFLMLSRVITNIYRMPLCLVIGCISLCVVGLIIVFYRIYIEDIKRRVKKDETKN